MIPLFVLLYIVIGIPQTYLDSTATVEERVQDLLSRMTLDEKIGQMTQADRGHLDSNDDITTYYLGSLLSGGGSAPETNTPQGWADMYDGYQQKALETRLQIPLIYGIDAVHGHNNVRGAVIFPHNIGLGCTWNPVLVQEAARITALEVAGTGIDWTFAPCIAVPRNERWGRTYEGFGETAEITTMMSEASVTGFQGDSLNQSKSIVACAKHFIGDGGTTGGEDQGNTEIDEATLRAIHLPGYISAIDAGVGTIMATYNSWNGEKVHGHKYLLTNVLKTELSFDGFVISDWNGIDQLNANYREAVKQAIDAGIDMAMSPDTYSDFYTTLKQLVNDGEIPISRIDDAVARILRIKFHMGLFEHPFTKPSLTDSVGKLANRQVARQCVRESMVLLKKENGILPLSKQNGAILVAGTKANNIGYQCGGWTISWQGGSGNITTGTTILEAIENAAGGASVLYSESGTETGDADAAVVVIGETPYAEGTGDREDLHFGSSDVATLRRVKEAGIPTVVVLISGRPMILDNLLHYADVLFAAWLPGTEGDGIADILFGDYQPTAKLTHSWPRSMNQIPLNWGDEDYDPLYAYKHGLQSIQDDGPETPPEFHSALLQKNGQVLELAFSKGMADPSTVNGFSVFVNQVQVNISDIRLKANDISVLELELEMEANAGDALIVYYSPGTILAADGSALESFGPDEVYNLRNEGSGAQEIPGRVEAENYSDMSGVQLEPTSDTGGGSNVGWIDQTDWMEYLLMVPDSGTYQVDLRVAAQSQSARIGLVVDGEVQSILDLPVTGGWQIWETVSTEIILDEGLQTLRVFAFIGGYNLNWMEFQYVTSIEPASLTAAQFYLAPNYPNPFNPKTVISYQLPVTSEIELSIYNIIGQKIAILVSEKQPAGSYSVQWDASDFPSGTYLYQVTVNNPGMEGQKGKNFRHIRKMLLVK
jgi:beta-glucosidase